MNRKKKKPTRKRETDLSKAFNRILHKKKALSNLMESLGIAPLGTFHESEVIRIVLDVAGKFHVPVTSPGIKKRKLENLDYTDDLLDILQIELDKYVKSIVPTAKITADEIGNCETVGDVVELVKSKT